MPDRGPDEILNAALESSRNVKLGRGVVSKTSYVAALAAAVWGLIAWRLGDNLVTNVLLMSVGIAVSVFVIWYITATQKFAERNPGQALLEGAEFLEYSKWEAAAKGQSYIPDQPMIEIKPSLRLPEE